MDSERVIAIIPARGGSKSIPGKNIISFCGKPLIAWSIECALQSGCVDKVYVTTDDVEIAEVSRRYGAEVIMRPAELATDTASSDAALLHAIAEIEKQKKVDVVLFLQATSPLRTSNDIADAVALFFKERADSLFSAAKLDDFCAWKKDGNEYHSATFDYLNRGRRQDREPYFLENGSLYLFKNELFKKNKNRMGGKIAVSLMPLWKSYEIDNADDLETCEYYMKRKILGGEQQNIIFDNIELVVYDFDGVFTDNKVTLSENGIESVVVNRADGLAIDLLKQLGIRQIIISTETNSVVAARANKLKLQVMRGVENKKDVLCRYCMDNRIDLKKVVYVGNDINDYEAMTSVGYPVCPSDAVREVREMSKLVLGAKGGEGVVRELLGYFNH